MNNAHLLLLEDDPDWVETVREVVTPHLSSFTAATTLAEAEALIARRYFTVAIVDISLVHGDNKDNSGMRFLHLLAEHKLSDVVSTIVLSAYGSMAQQRTAFRDFGVVDFLPKPEDDLSKPRFDLSKARFDPQELLRALHTALAEKRRLEPLAIELESGRALASLWSRFNWPQREAPAELTYELADLLRRLFPGATDLFLQPLSAGQSGAGVVKAEPLYGAKRAASVIVKFGKREKIEAEHQNYEAYIERYIGYQASTQLGYVSGRAMGAIAYSFVGAELDAVTSLADYYPTASVEGVQRTLDNLLKHTCSRWYENREQPRRTRNLVKLYQEGLHIHTWDDIWQKLAPSHPEIKAPSLTFPGVAGEFRNPRHWLEERNYEVYMPVWLATTHGDLNEHNVLVTEDHSTWLIDFYRTGPGHILRDIVELECVIKFNLAGVSELADGFGLEAALLEQTQLSKPVAIPPGASFAKPLAAISHLRELAADFTGQGMREYHTALLLHTVYMLSLDFLYEAEPHRRDRVLLAAAMLAGALDRLH